MAFEESRKTGKINFELLLGLSATFLSFAALVVSLFQTKIARKQQHASVWPYLAAFNSNSANSNSYKVKNYGIGPAIIKNVKWETEDSVYTDTLEFVRSEIGYSKGLGRNEMESGYVITPEVALSLIEITDNDSSPQLIDGKLTSNSFSLRVIYSDVYGNYRELNKGKSKSLRECPK